MRHQTDGFAQRLFPFTSLTTIRAVSSQLRLPLRSLLVNTIKTGAFNSALAITLAITHSTGQRFGSSPEPQSLALSRLTRAPTSASAMTDLTPHIQALSMLILINHRAACATAPSLSVSSTKFPRSQEETSVAAVSRQSSPDPLPPMRVDFEKTAPGSGMR